MFNEISIVETAVNSFNNSALLSPYFFAIGFLSLPLFYFAYIYGREILNWLKWNTGLETKVSFWSVLVLTMWLLIFGGNYAVIRDGISLLPLMIAIVLFVSVLYITKQAINLNYLSFFKNKKSFWIVFTAVILLAVLSAKPDIYGILLQVSAVFCGVLVGARIRKNPSDLVVSTVIFGTMTTLILMQPEYFRFGQLGNLTITHLIILLLTGFFAITALVSKYAKARSKIRETAYIKLKWLVRIIASLALVLFALTESVPVFMGLLIMITISEILTIYHSKHQQTSISKYSWAMMIVCFGLIIICPVITCLGLFCVSQQSEKISLKDFLRLL